MVTDLLKVQPGPIGQLRLPGLPQDRVEGLHPLLKRNMNACGASRSQHGAHPQVLRTATSASQGLRQVMQEKTLGDRKCTGARLEWCAAEVVQQQGGSALWGWQTAVEVLRSGGSKVS